MMPNASNTFHVGRWAAVSMLGAPVEVELDHASAVTIRHERIKRIYAGINAMREAERNKKCRMTRLLLHQAGMAGDALPLSQIQHPRVCEAANMVVRLALICALR